MGMKLLVIFGMLCLFGLLVVVSNWTLLYNNTINEVCKGFCPKFDRWHTQEENAPKRGYRYLPEHEFTDGGGMIVQLLSTNATLSRMYTLNKKSTYHLGDDIDVIINLHDNRGKQKQVGGDYLRLWMSSPKLTASVSGDVIDFNNGTYHGRLKALWVGHAYIRVLVARRREEIALYYTFYKHYHSLWKIYGQFVNGKTVEISECFPTPWGYTNFSSQWCNVTNLNDGLPWYCKKPQRPGLSCDMYEISWSEGSTSGIRNKLFHWLKDQKDVLEPVNIAIRSEDGSRTVSPSLIPCNDLPPEVTWNRKSPNGFFYKGKWRSLHCSTTLPRSPATYRECLKGKTLWLPGDSTSAQFKTRLHLFLNFTPRSQEHKHEPQFDSDPQHNFTISWHAHEMPFFHGLTRHLKSTNQGQHVILDHLPNASKDMVVLYLYSHFTLVHPDVFRQHVQKLVQSAQNLLHRAPNVTLAVRGPHAFYRNDLWLLSYWGLLYSNILHQEFSKLQTKVVYLDYWDMTVAWPSSDINPSNKTADKMVHNMMSRLCFRKK